MPPPPENTITVRRGHVSTSRVEFAHEIQYRKQSKSVWTSEGPFLNSCTYRLPCSHIAANYITIREKDRHGILYAVNIFFPATN